MDKLLAGLAVLFSYICGVLPQRSDGNGSRAVGRFKSTFIKDVW